MEATLQFLYGELHTPPHGILAQNRASTGTQEIGHDALDALRPKVSPFFGAYDRDIAQLMQLSVTHKDPLILSPAIGVRGDATTIACLWQVLDHITYVFTIGEFARARHGKDRRPAQLFNQF
jgi:hypothetical protein